MSDRLIAVILLAVCGFFYWQSFFIRKPPFAAFESLGAETFPRAIVVVLALFSLILLIRGRGALAPRLVRERLRPWLERYRLPLTSLALFAAYAAAIAPLGWLVATVAYLVAMQFLLLPRSGRAIGYVLAGSFAFAFLVGQLFERFLHVVLPRAGLF